MSKAIKLPLLIISVLFIVGIILYSNHHRITAVSETALMMDTAITIKVYAKAGEAETFIKKGFDHFSRIEQEISFHIADSQLSRLNRFRENELKGSLGDCMKLAEEMNIKTQGYFDPTFAIIQRAYGFYDKKGRLPSEDELERILQETGWKSHVKLDVSEGKIYLRGSAEIDLGGIAGGYAIEKAAKAIKDAGCQDFLIDDAGDIWVEGRKSDGSPWRISVRDPRDNGSLAMIEIKQPTAVSTSGNYERYVTVNGKNYGHIMNPLTGRPADYYQSVTVIASSPVLADVYSTAFYAMPPEIGKDWAEKLKIPVLALTSAGEIQVNRYGEAWFRNIRSN
ncbi:MAG: FAD:protein FMN transferase [Candidatus Rifleibacteriota bacterium]